MPPIIVHKTIANGAWDTSTMEQKIQRDAIITAVVIDRAAASGGPVFVRVEIASNSVHRELIPLSYTVNRGGLACFQPTWQGEHRVARNTDTVLGCSVGNYTGAAVDIGMVIHWDIEEEF